MSGGSGIIVPGKECQAGHGYFGGWRGRLIIRSGAAVVAPRATHICGGQFCCCLPTGSSPMAAGMVATRPYVWVSNFRAKNFKLRTKLKLCNDHSSNNLSLMSYLYMIYMHKGCKPQGIYLFQNSLTEQHPVNGEKFEPTRSLFLTSQFECIGCSLLFLLWIWFRSFPRVLNFEMVIWEDEAVHL